jgi:hypothetical protein
VELKGIERPVLWVDLKSIEPTGVCSGPNMEPWNPALHDAATTYPNLSIFEWSEVVQDEWYAGDGVHYTSAGSAERARLIADALAGL